MGPLNRLVIPLCMLCILCMRCLFSAANAEVVSPANQIKCADGGPFRL